MAFRNSDKYKYSVVSVCMEVNSAIKGTGDYPSDFADKVAWLRWRCEEGWDKEDWRLQPLGANVDGTVREMARAVVMFVSTLGDGTGDCDG